MSKKQIHTNLVGRRVRLTEEAEQHVKWHSSPGPLWRYGDPSDVTTAEFVGDFSNMPGGKAAGAEIVAVHLNSDGDVVAAIQWDADGTIEPDVRIEYLQVAPWDPE